MDTISPPDYIENPERAALIFDPDFPNAATDTGERLAMQRLFAQLQQIELAANVDTDRSRKCSDDIQRIAVPVNVLKRFVRDHRSISNSVYFASGPMSIGAEHILSHCEL